MLGSGVNTTTLKLYNFDSGDRCLLGIESVPTVPLDGFEASDFTLDCGYSGTPGTANRATFLYGQHIYLRRLRVQNFGGSNAAQMIVVLAASVQSEDCVVEECTIDATVTGIGNATCVLIGFVGNSGNLHRFCVTRNCTCRGPATGTAHGIHPGSALGFIAEGNQLVDLSSGIYDPPYAPGTETASDIIIRHNYFRNAQNGIGYSGRAWPLGRMIVHDNVMDIRNNGTGILLLGNTNPIVYTALIIRKNVIRNVNWDAVPGTITGVNISRVQDLNIQFNTINNTTTGTGIVTANVTNATVNNNINTSGQSV